MQELMEKPRSEARDPCYSILDRSVLEFLLHTREEATLRTLPSQMYSQHLPGKGTHGDKLQKAITFEKILEYEFENKMSHSK